jgi:hypothetical protein
MYNDGTVEKSLCSGWDLTKNKYWPYLDAEDKEHFQKMKDILAKELVEEQADYSLFLHSGAPKLIRISIGTRCLESKPCQHDCTFFYDDGTTEESRCSGWTLTKNEYWPYLSLKDKGHFRKMKDILRKESDKKQAAYSLFLALK